MISRTVIDNYLWKVQSYLQQQYGCDQASRDMDALNWYIGTGRASVAFLSALVSKKPYLVGRLLHKGGSNHEAIERIKNYVQL